MLFSKKHRKRKIKKSGNNYNKNCCPPLSTSKKGAKTVHGACRKFNSNRIN